MFLKKIELHGFKSFANRVEIDFQPGINAIVGPNGCGKSNIADAIRWVLGEQSIRSLRGSKLVDVIFAGSRSKKPMGMAEVSITLDNYDKFIPIEYSEICIVRRAFRSGESEFYLNKTLCRLKDIQELLMDTGIGKDGYSIIGQGQIDEVLTYHPDERRAIFEETAGITKHRARKREAEKRLDETVDNITRLDDILAEISLQLQPLADQKDKAIEYGRFANSLKQIDVNLHLACFDEKSERISSLTGNITDYEKQLKSLLLEANVLINKITTYEKEMGLKEEELEDLQQQYHNCYNQREGAQKDLKWSEEESMRIEDEIDSLAQRASDLTKKISSARGSLDLKVIELEQKIKDINFLDLHINELEGKISSLEDMIKQKESQIEGLKGDVIDILNYISEKRNMMSSLNTMRNNLNGRMIQIERENKELDETNKKTSDEIHRAQDDSDKIALECERLEVSTRELEAAIKRMQEEYATHDINYRKKQQQLSALISKLKALKEINDDFEGYSYGARNLLLSIKNKKLHIDGLYGPVAELITVEKGYEAAIEAALGGALQNIICDDEQSAKQAIEYLKKYNMGRVTFLPLSAAVHKTLSVMESSLLSVNGCISTADKLVAYDKIFNPVISYLLGRVLVVDGMDNGIYIAKKCRYSLKIVTVNGEVFSPGGAITGGSQKKSNLILTRKRAIEEHKLNIKLSESELSDLGQKKESLMFGIEEKKSILERTRAKISDLKVQLAAVRQQIEEKQNILQERLKRKEQLKLEQRQINEQIKETDLSFKTLENDKKVLDSLSASNQNEAEALQIYIAEEKAKRDELYTNITELRIKFASNKQEEIGLKQNIQALELNIDELSTDLKNVEEKLEQAENAKKLLYKKIVCLRETVAKYADMQDEFRKIIEQHKNDKDRLKVLVEELKGNLGDIEKRQKEVEKKLNDLKINEATANIEMTEIKNRLWEKYEITLEEAEQMRRDLGDVGRMKESITEVQEKITLLGTVNMRAIEEYDNLRARYDFLKSQRDDLVEAKYKLDGLIDEITRIMRDMFRTSFEKVRVEFNKVFSELFGGGKAELVIQGEGDLLESGIDMIAQPPGKKLQNISLLSGGERTLTAIALLFAILNTKSTPFCILDEIEAALDEINIERFTQYLKQVSQQTQFIIITHRKNTMEVADALYGIAMEDTAVSKVLAVKIEQ